MKKIILLCLIIVAVFSGCGHSEPENTVSHDDLNDPAVIEAMTPDIEGIIMEIVPGVELSEQDALTLLKQKVGEQNGELKYVYKIKATYTIEGQNYYYGTWTEKNTKTDKKEDLNFFLKTDGTEFILADYNKKENKMENIISESVLS